MASSDLARWYARWLSALVATLLVLATTSAAGALPSSTYDYDVTSTAVASTASRGIDSAVRPVQTRSVVSEFNYDDLPNFVATNALDDILPKPVVSDPKLQNIVNDLYKGTTNPNRVGTGTTADAVRNELATGLKTGGTFHSEKAQIYINGLNNVLKTDLSASDRLVAQSLLDDLVNALGGAP